MFQKHFDLQQKCNNLEGRNAELEEYNVTLKQGIKNLCFEVELLKDVVAVKMKKKML